MKTKKINRIGLALVAALSLPVFLSASVSAVGWGPDRPTYTNENPADHAVFNSITNNAAVGDERNFVRIAEKKADGSAQYVDELTLEPGKDYEVFIYFHNDASATYNDKEHNRVGVAQNTRIASGFPDRLEAGQSGTVTGKITSSTTNPEAVWDDAKVTAGETLTLVYDNASAKLTINEKFNMNGETLPITLFDEAGMLIGLNNFDGVIPGCDEFSGYITYVIRTHGVDTPVDPEDPDKPVDPEDPETPEELPDAGAAEIILAVVIVVAVGAGVLYYRKSSHDVKKVTKKAKGKK